ncbi:uncharacterized protein BXZ73DRAFT_100920 [Epithele typhae]|uniref:uncharacterized protein n=1 Tax=Epithele typhae TaxID=378194 RepID=UPI002007E88C|nr:uncharacterized protein BXZ73DRAFT_100920 [Epithele typhae]KAH9934082.1 hypothetical protein BXZ73DRAFT_100920 [Epithele typhae]
MRLPTELLALLACAAQAWANTEIVNFDVSLSPDLPLPQAAAWPTLSPEAAEQLFHVTPAPLGASIADVCEPATLDSLGACPHELWLALGTDAPPWDGFTKFTLRISWPATSPADFHIDTFAPDELVQRLRAPHLAHVRLAARGRTRRRFARVRVVSTGVLTPSADGAHARRAREPVSFVVRVEPLYFGVLPGSVVPVVLLLLAVAAAAGFVVRPVVQRRLEEVAGAVRAGRVREEKSE